MGMRVLFNLGDLDKELPIEQDRSAAFIHYQNPSSLDNTCSGRPLLGLGSLSFLRSTVAGSKI
jgi:hypothetical protein